MKEQAMARRLAQPGEIVELQPPSPAVEAYQQLQLMTTNYVEVTQLMIPAGRRVPTHKAEGEVIIHCLTGSINVDALGTTHALRGRQLLYLHAKQNFSIQATEDASVLVTFVSPMEGPDPELIGRSKRR